jgi:hypothetical protein
VTVNGNTVTIQIPINYYGNAATPALISQLNSFIQTQWSGTFGKYTVTTTVTDNSSWYDIFSPSNSVQLVNNPQPGYFKSNSATWYQPGQGDPVWEATHEAGHLMGLPDQYTNAGGAEIINSGFENNIMGRYGAMGPTAVTEDDISNIINANTPWYIKAGNAISDALVTPAYAPSGSGSANANAGGGSSAAASSK